MTEGKNYSYHLPLLVWYLQDSLWRGVWTLQKAEITIGWNLVEEYFLNTGKLCLNKDCLNFSTVTICNNPYTTLNIHLQRQHLTAHLLNHAYNFLRFQKVVLTTRTNDLYKAEFIKHYAVHEVLVDNGNSKRTIVTGNTFKLNKIITWLVTDIKFTALVPG